MTDNNTGVLTTSREENRFGPAKGGMKYDLTHSHLNQLPGNATVIGAALENDQKPPPTPRTITIIDTSKPRAPMIQQVKLTGHETPRQDGRVDSAAEVQTVVVPAVPRSVTPPSRPLPPPPVIQPPPVTGPPSLPPDQLPVQPQQEMPEYDTTIPQLTTEQRDAELAMLIESSRTPETPQTQVTFQPHYQPVSTPTTQAPPPYDYSSYIEMPFLQTNLMPGKPRKKVLFETPLGSLTARYHDVVLADRTLVLIIDRRDEDHDKFVPAETVGPTAPPMTITVEVIPKQPQRLKAFYFGNSFTFGCFDIMVLMLTPPEDARDDTGAVEPTGDNTDPVDYVYQGNLPPALGERRRAP